MVGANRARTWTSSGTPRGRCSCRGRRSWPWTPTTRVRANQQACSLTCVCMCLPHKGWTEATNRNARSPNLPSPPNKHRRRLPDHGGGRAAPRGGLHGHERPLLPLPLRLHPPPQRQERRGLVYAFHCEWMYMRTRHWAGGKEGRSFLKSSFR